MPVTIVNCFASKALFQEGPLSFPLDPVDCLALVVLLVATAGSLWTDNLLNTFVTPICPGHPQDWLAPV